MRGVERAARARMERIVFMMFEWNDVWVSLQVFGRPGLDLALGRVMCI